jgi:hypothetical protein
MLQWLYTYVSNVSAVFQMHVVSVCFKCFSYFKRMLQVFYLDVAYIAVTIRICCMYIFQMFHLFLTYVAASASCYECFH